MSPARPPRHPFLDRPGPAAFAHRGGAGEGAENTLSAFRAAVDIGYRYLETDAHVTTDGVVVAFHDDDLSRTAGRPGRISELPWSEVAAARVHGTETIPRLADVYEAFPTTAINVDCKSDAVVGPLGDLLAERPERLERTCVGSFKTARLRPLRRRFGSELCTSYATGEIAWFRLLGVAAAGVQVVQAPVTWHGLPLITARFVRRCHRRGLAVHVWTIDDPAEMDRLLDLGVDGLMTDRPEVLKSVLSRRGQWVSLPEG